MATRMGSILGAALLAFAALPVAAEQAVSTGDYTIHYNAVPSELLEPAVASAYDIRRSRNRALLNVSVLKKNMGLTGQPVRARVTASATNLNAQLRQVPMREIADQGAIYYIGLVPIHDQEVLKFTIEVQPEGEDAPTVVRFEQQFFID